MASPVSQTLGVWVVVFILLYGGAMILRNEGDLKAHEFVVYLATFSQVMTPIKALTDSFSGIHSGISAGERVSGLWLDSPHQHTKLCPNRVHHAPSQP